ncbi:MAG: hypothetical protein ETSY2_11780 [Candidatus Entotheonella gemina]|uniref:Uncharacterized protein n=1 Tax=Candidatus Entotheonella gemina TaxID=1429439 RepID=W4MAW8_9BACT|nr:MAG: hypothetical protein ETSY2_11780 [Candidatus Entotheonella gemina]
MISNPWFYQLLLAVLVLVCLIMHVWWPDPLRVAPPAVKPINRRRTRFKESKPFAGYIQQPLCEACEHGVDSRPKAPGSPPPLILFNRGRKRTVDTAGHFCPDPDCSYHGWLGRGNLRANGHPGGQPWRPFQCVSCQGFLYERMAPFSMANAPHRS